MRQFLERSMAAASDGAMCAMMNFLQRRHNAQAATLEDFENYIAACAPLSREEYYAIPHHAVLKEDGEWVEWESPRPSGVAANDHARIRLHLCPQGHSAPTILILHALMSASDIGYIKLAKWFNARGWNAAFPHLPYHYSRNPKGCMNGELAITANLVRNVENIRQCVVELRQFMALLRTRDCKEFALLGTSYGGWNAALLSFLEPDLRFLALIQPIINIEYTIWDNPISATISRHLQSQGYARGRSVEHSHLSSPAHGIPLCGGERCVITGGLYDSISPLRDLEALQRSWPGSVLLEVPQGHFGYRALRATLPEIERLLG